MGSIRATVAMAAFATAAILVISPPVRAEPARILAYGDSNTWGWRATEAGLPTVRLPRSARWTGLLDDRLGPYHTVVEDGLNLRTTDLDDPVGGGGQLAPEDYKGAASLPAALAANAPLDLVILALGQNDLQTRFARSPAEIADAIAGLVGIVRASAGEIGTTYPAPEVVILAPLPLPDTLHPAFAEGWSGGPEASRAVAAAVRARGEEQGFEVVDVTAATGAVGGVDGLHLTPAQHRVIARLLAEAVRARLDLIPMSPAVQGAP